MELCLIILAKNEMHTLTETIDNIQKKLKSEIPFNILVMNKHSDYGTLPILENLSKIYSNLNYVSREWDGGIGNAIRFGFTKWQGDFVTICMADGSDALKAILFSHKMICGDGNEVAFGSRFLKGGQVEKYHFRKYFSKSIFNNWVRIKTGVNCNEFVNIFNLYTRRSIKVIFPLDFTGFIIVKK
ncbi:MAG: hypothetical protein CFE21_07085 [Bacteroidetes bacterium B1(2017)]|nr:MAG: hypothetical protein CFE21_07085 [Bacteroidetes bacterium B1(2017)]